MINKAINATITNDKKWPTKQPGDAATGQPAAPATAPSAAKTGAMVHHRPRHHLRGHDSKGPNTPAATGPQLPAATGMEAGVSAHRRQHQQGGASSDDA